MQSSVEAKKTFGLFSSPANRKIISDLVKTDSELLEFPQIEVCRTDLPAHINIISDLKSYNWIMFTDILAVDYFLTALEENDVDFFELDEISVCALGEAVVDRLRFAQLHADLVPQNLESQTIFQAFKDYVNATDDFAGLKILIVKDDFREFEFLNYFARTKIQLDYLPIYKFHIENNLHVPKIKALLKGGAVDEFVFGSVVDVLFFSQIIYPDVLQDYKKDMVFSANDGATLQYLREHNLNPVYFKK